jgi:transposase
MSLTPIQKAQAIAFHQSGWKPGKIADQFNAHRTTISRFIKAFEKTSSFERKKGSGRAKKLTPRNVRHLLKFARGNRRRTLNDFRKALTVKVSNRTLRRALHANGFHCRVAKKKPFLMERHIRERLAFARKYKNWTKDDWRKVLWTDESSFERGKYSRQHRVWRRPHEKDYLECLAPTFKSDRITVMVWGGITYGKKTDMVIFKKEGRRRRMSAKDYVDQVYEGPLRRFLENHQDIILMEDGAPIHRSNAPKIWRQEHNIVKLDWPAQSPDLNPLENLWYRLKLKVQNATYAKMSSDKFEKVIVDSWNAFSTDEWNNLIDSMPERIKAVLDAKGGSTRW